MSKIIFLTKEMIKLQKNIMYNVLAYERLPILTHLKINS